MADEQMGLFRALWRFVTFYGLRKQLGLVRAADRMFTGSTEGIGDAFDLHRDQLIRRYNDLFDAFGQLETVLEEKRLESEALTKEHKDLVGKRDGALTMYERAEQTGNAEDQQKHKAAFERFQGRLKQIEVRQGELTDDVKSQEERMRGFERQLTSLQAEIQALPVQKAQAMADFVSNQKVIELAGDAANGIKGHVGLSADAPIPQIQEFRKKYEERFKSVPDHNALKGYLGVYAVKYATQKIGKFDRKALAEKMKGLRITVAEEPGILMDVTWDKNGDLDRISFLAEVINGQQKITQTLPALGM